MRANYYMRLHEVANKQITIDLDDGIVVNYAKYGDVLAKLKWQNIYNHHTTFKGGTRTTQNGGTIQKGIDYDIRTNISEMAQSATTQWKTAAQAQNEI